MSEPASNPTNPQPEHPKIRILLVDDHAIVRQGLRMFIELQPDMTVVGEGSDGNQAIALTAQLQPDVILLDLAMPNMDGVEATQKILTSSPNSRVLILTSFGDDERVFPAIRAGAHGYMLKDILPGDLVQAIRGTFQDQTQLHPQVARRLMTVVSENLSQPKPKPSALPVELESLTEREREVLGLIAQGMNNREIAEKMVVSESTVKTHVSNLLDKLNLEDRTRAAIWAIKHGLGNPES
jgi:DNA-binding NarL/FixJ family response regulator